MKFKLSIGFLVGLLGMFHPGISQETEKINNFTLDDCISYAVEHNQMLKNASLEMNIAKARVGETVADGLPQINGNVDLAYNFQVPTSFVPAILFDENAPEGQFAPVKFGTSYSGNASITLNQMIFNGSYFVGLQAAKTFQELSRKDRVKTEIDVVQGVQQAYYLTMITKERMDLIRANYYRLDTLLKETQAMNESGFAEKIDVSRVQVQMNNITVEKKNVERSMLLAHSLLKFQMGMPVEQDLVLVETIKDVEFEVMEEEIISSFRAENRIEYSQLQTNLDLVNLDIKNNKMQYAPQLNLYGSYGANSGTENSSDLFNFGDNWFSLGIVGVAMNVPIFDGLRKGKRIQQKKIQKEQINNQFEYLKNSINYEVQEAQTNYSTSVENMKAQKENMALAEEIYDVTRIKYQEGVGSNQEVLDADTSYKTAQTNYYNALYDALVAKVSLEKAYGKLLEK